MIIPVRCFTCGKPLGSTWHPYTNLIAEGCSRNEALDHLGLRRYCCRRMVLAHVELSEKFMHVQQRVETRSNQSPAQPAELAGARG